MLTEFTIDKPMPANPSSALRRWSCLLLAILATGLLIHLGSIALFPGTWDQLAHFFLFAGISMLLWIATGGRMPFAVIGLVAGIGAVDEWHQAGLPGRSLDYADCLIDALAASLAVAVLKLRDILS